MPIEPETRADQMLVAAPAVRPPVLTTHRGRRSAAGKLRRWHRWAAQRHGTQPTALLASFLDSALHSAPSAVSPTTPITPTPPLCSTACSSASFSMAASVTASDSSVVQTGVPAKAQADVPGGPLLHSSLLPQARDTGASSAATHRHPIPPASNIHQANSTNPSVNSNFNFFHLNPRGLTTENLAKVSALVDSIGRPEVVGFTETWLERRHVELAGYRRVSQRDRQGRVRGDRCGIALFAVEAFADSVVHLADSSSDERSWHIIHADTGPILLCLWYRPPDEDIASINRFNDELSQHSSQAVSCIVMGDLNVHHKEWLKHSNGTTKEGIELEGVCCEQGLRQLVSSPTRGPYLLDFVFSDMESEYVYKGARI